MHMQLKHGKLQYLILLQHGLQPFDLSGSSYHTFLCLVQQDLHHQEHQVNDAHKCANTEHMEGAQCSKRLVLRASSKIMFHSELTTCSKHVPVLQCKKKYLLRLYLCLFVFTSIRLLSLSCWLACT
jgi:hypothetical protein